MLLYSTLAIINQSVKNKYILAKIPYNKKGLDVIIILYNMGYLTSYYIIGNYMYIELKYYQDQIVFNGFFFHNKPGHIKSISIAKLRREYIIKKKVYILSTSSGICSTLDALRKNISGFILAEIK
jgi:ribosomal protein S8